MQTLPITLLLLATVANAAAAQIVTKTTVRSSGAYAIGNDNAGASISATTAVTRSAATIYANGLVIPARRWDHTANRSAYATLFGVTAEAAGISGRCYAANGRWTETYDYSTRQWRAANFVHTPLAGYSLTLRVAGMAEQTISAQASVPLSLGRRVTRTLFTTPRLPFDVPLGIVSVDGTVTAEGGFSGAIATNFEPTRNQTLIDLAADGYVAGTFSGHADFLVAAISIDGALRIGDIGARFRVYNDPSLVESVVSRVEFAIAPLSASAVARLRIGSGWLSYTREDPLFSWSAPSIYASHTLR